MKVISSIWTAPCLTLSTTLRQAATSPFALMACLSIALTQFEECYACFRQHYLHHNLDTTAPYPGIMELIAKLNANGKKVAVVSNKFYEATQDLVRHFFGEEIKVAIGERPDIHKKPAPDTVIEALRQLDMPSSTAVYIGDSDVDIDTARNCGMPCISVLWGFRDRDFLIEHGATTLVKTPGEIAAI